MVCIGATLTVGSWSQYNDNIMKHNDNMLIDVEEEEHCHEP